MNATSIVSHSKTGIVAGVHPTRGSGFARPRVEPKGIADSPAQCAHFVYTPDRTGLLPALPYCK